MSNARLDGFTRSGDRTLGFSGSSRDLVAYEIDEVLDVLAEAEAATAEGLWAVGYVGYDATPAFDPSLPVRPREPRDGFDELPLAWFGLFTDHTEPPPFVGEARLTASPYTVSSWIPTLDEERYQDRVRRIRRLIRSGELTQVNYALRLDAAMSGDLTEFYRDLVLSQRGEYGAYLDLGRYRVLSASPERFFKIDGTTINIRPMKGAAGRGRWASEDRHAAEQLLVSERHRTEHRRIVEQMRSELASICAPGTVVSDASMNLQRFETVWELVSDVSAELGDDVGVADVFRALFPSAAVTGDPKLRAMETIATLEGHPRGIYAGAIGFMSPSGSGYPDASFSVAIRTLVVDTEEGIGEYGVGAGITDASPARGEYDEAQAKTRILTQRRPEASLFERIRWEEEVGFRWLDRHLRRLEESAAYFGFRFDDRAVREALDRAVEGRAGSCAVRLDTDRSGAVTAVVETEGLPTALWWPNDAGDPVVCEVNTDPISSRSIYRFHKTTARQPYVERREAHGDVDEVLMVNERGEVTEGTGHNVTVQIAGVWVTPPLASGCMPGVLRSVLLDEGALIEEVVMVEDLESADAVAVINSVSGWRPARLQGR